MVRYTVFELLPKNCASQQKDRQTCSRFDDVTTTALARRLAPLAAGGGRRAHQCHDRVLRKPGMTRQTRGSPAINAARSVRKLLFVVIYSRCEDCYVRLEHPTLLDCCCVLTRWPRRRGAPPRKGACVLLETVRCSIGPKEFFYRGHHYFFSGHVPALANRKVDWLDGRNICREYCMDLVSMETQEENNLIFKLIQQNDVPYIWTSGRLCDFKGCEQRKDLEPKNIFGWFWSANREKISPTNQIPNGWGYNPWSKTGHKKQPQPDNAEFDINSTTESCLSVLNNVYNDGIAWHDVACYHEKPIVCEDSEELLQYIASTNPGLRL
ncbi:hypothetical protein EVAR_95163_1 [Eumeta japonica]|uniref:C-type lectin domain-containing protein n=1 Tax=Eumeta variegata TaxID=151549 RepID=A0A4C1VFX1_EUMVA|nr:hypothetical protein EVAR_95163_1 [Eumeta japonica]